MTGQSVHFDASGSKCFATPCTYTWEDDPPSGGIWPLGNGQTLDFTFVDPATKYVTLTVTDAANQTATVEHDVIVGAAPAAAPSNTALPVISGTAAQGQTLTTSNGSWNGSPTSYAYQWRRCDSSGNNCTNISGASGGSYTLASGDVGHTVDVVVTATNAGGSTSATSNQTVAVAAPPPTASFGYSPASPVTGQSVHFDASGSKCFATPCTYTWEDDPPSGGIWPLGNGQTLDFTFVDPATKYVTLTVTDAANQTATVEHDVSVGAAPAAAPSNTALPLISGTAAQGQTLTTSNGSWNGSPTSYAYQWRRCDTSGNNCTNISGVSGGSYTLASGDVGHTVDVVLSATNAGGSTSATSNPSNLVVAGQTTIAPSNTALPTITGTPTQGQMLSTSNGTWSGSPTSYSYQWKDCDSSGNNCTNITGATSSGYALTSNDAGHTLRAVVSATNSGGSTSATSAQTTLIQSGSTSGGATVVGTAAEPNVSCSSTISVGASVQNALAAASPGQVVCLNAGSWSQQTLTGLTPASPGVTLAAKPGASVSMAGITTSGTVNNLTVEGIQFTGSFGIFAQASQITLRYNNFQHISTWAVNDHPGSNTTPVDQLKIIYNQMDHVYGCLGLAYWDTTNLTFSHNVCGPGIGYGSTDGNAHYLQTEPVNGFTVDNNAFLGPFDPTALASNGGAHNNVSHANGDNFQFDNNILWHTDSRAQTVLWGDDAAVSGAEAKNNLIVEDPNDSNCNGSGIDCPTWSLWEDGIHGDSNINFSNNTILENNDGGIYAGGPSSGRPAITGLTVQNNIAVDQSGKSGNAFAMNGNSCTCSGNVSDNGSAPGSGSIGNWAQSWQDTSWTPSSGSPWNPPQADYYKPSSIASTYGYQGTIGP